jgi:hypothetical protein
MSSDRWGDVSRSRCPLSWWFAALAFAVAGCASAGGERLETRVFSFELGPNWFVERHEHEGVLALFPATISSIEDAQRILGVTYCFRGQLPPNTADDSSVVDPVPPYQRCGDSVTCGPEVLTDLDAQGAIPGMRLESDVQRRAGPAGETVWLVPVKYELTLNSGIDSLICSDDWWISVMYARRGSLKQSHEDFEGFLRTFRWSENPFALPPKSN